MDWKLFGLIAAGVAALVILFVIIKDLREQKLREKLRAQLPQTYYAEVAEIIKHTEEVIVGTYYDVKIDAVQRNGVIIRKEYKCRNTNLKTGDKIAIA